MGNTQAEVDAASGVGKKKCLSEGERNEKRRISELSANLTAKKCPGDAIRMVKEGPTLFDLAAGRSSQIFLARNARGGNDWVRRRLNIVGRVGTRG